MVEKQREAVVVAVYTLGQAKHVYNKHLNCVCLTRRGAAKRWSCTGQPLLDPPWPVPFSSIIQLGACLLLQIVARPELDKLKSQKDAVIWLWQTHNEVWCFIYVLASASCLPSTAARVRAQGKGKVVAWPGLLPSSPHELCEASGTLA